MLFQISSVKKIKQLPKAATVEETAGDSYDFEIGVIKRFTGRTCFAGANESVFRIAEHHRPIGHCLTEPLVASPVSLIDPLLTLPSNVVEQE